MDAKIFVWKNIVTWFRIPRTLILDNDLQFDSKTFRRYCCDLGITNTYSTPAYPQGNGQAEIVNKVIVNELKKKLYDAKGKLVEELPHVLWTYRNTPRRSKGETPFSITYGAEAVISLEIRFPTLRISSFTSSNNDGLLEKSLDLRRMKKKCHGSIGVLSTQVQAGVRLNVRLRPLAPGDLVLRRVLGTTKNPTWGKLWPN